MTHIFILALAQTAPPASGGGFNKSALIFQLVAFVGIFWFLLFRPQQQERKRLESSQMQLKRGDEVVTVGGIIAEVVHIQMQPAAEGQEAVASMSDRVTVRSGESKLVVERGRIARVIPKGT